MKNKKLEYHRYTVKLDDDLHSWLKERAGGSSISPIIVFILNERRLAEQQRKERNFEDSR